MTSLANSQPDSAALAEQRGRPFMRWGLISLTILPGLLLTVLVYRYGVNVPYWDEWDNSVVLHMKYMDGTLTVGDLFTYTNEHRPALPRLIDLIVEILTHGNRRAEMFVQIAVAGCMVYCIFRLARKTVPDHALPLTAVASWLVFSTVQYENWLWGEQLVLVLPVTLLWFGLAMIYSDRSYFFKVIAGILTGLAAICCFAGGFAIYALLGAVQLMHGRAKRTQALVATFLWIAAFSVAARMYSSTSPVGTPPPMPQLLWLLPGISAVYIAMFFGAPFWSHEPPFSGMIAIGALLVIVSLIPFARAWRTFDRALPWAAAFGFSCIMALLTLSGRLQFGIQQAMTSRYATFALLLPVAAMFLWAVTFPRWPRVVRRLMIVVAALFFAANLYASILSVRDMRTTYIRRRDALAELPYINVHDAEQSKSLRALYPDRTRLSDMANAYSAHGILPPMVKP